MTKKHEAVEAMVPESTTTCGCGIGAGTGADTDDGNVRHAVAVDPDIKARNMRRLKRIEGQVRGVQRMVSEERYCADILTQLSSVQEALRAVGKELMRNHLRHCAGEAIGAGGERADAMYDELIELMYKNLR